MKDDMDADSKIPGGTSGGDLPHVGCGEVVDDAPDKDLSGLLKHWQAPAASAGLDSQVTAAYRRELRRPHFWRRLLSSRIAVPVPVAAAVLVILAITTFLAVRKLEQSTAGTGKAAAPVSQATDSVTGSKPVAVDAAQARPTSNANPSQAPASGTAYVTRADLTGFKPVKTLTITVLPRRNANER